MPGVQIMNVQDLKKLLESVPDNYEVRSRYANAHLNNDEMWWQFNFSDYVDEVKIIHSKHAIMILRS